MGCFLIYTPITPNTPLWGDSVVIDVTLLIMSSFRHTGGAVHALINYAELIFFNQKLAHKKDSQDRLTPINMVHSYISIFLLKRMIM